MWGSTLFWHRIPRSHVGFWGQGQPPSSQPHHTPRAGTRLNVLPGLRDCAEICALPAEEEAGLPQGLPVPARQGHQDLPRGMPSLIFQSFQWRNHLLTRAGTFQCLPFTGSAGTSSSLNPVSCRASAEFTESCPHNTFYSSRFN